MSVLFYRRARAQLPTFIAERLGREKDEREAGEDEREEDSREHERGTEVECGGWHVAGAHPARAGASQRDARVRTMNLQVDDPLAMHLVEYFGPSTAVNFVI